MQLHEIQSHCTEVQADFRRLLECRTLFHLSSLFPNRCHMPVHSAFCFTATWLTFEAEKMLGHLEPDFLFSSLLQLYLILLREKIKIVTSRPGESLKLSARQISGCVMIFVIVHRGKSFETLGYDAYVACKYVQSLSVHMWSVEQLRSRAHSSPFPCTTIPEIYLVSRITYSKDHDSTWQTEKMHFMLVFSG